MNSEIAMAIKDSVKLNILSDVINKNMTISFQIDNGIEEDYLSQIHNEKSRVKVYGKFNVSEDPTGEILTIRPVAPDCRLTIKTSVTTDISGKKVSIVRSETKTVEKEYEITQNINQMEFIPCGKQGYTFRIAFSGHDGFENVNTVEDDGSKVITAPENEISVSSGIFSGESSEFAGFSISSQDRSDVDDRFEATSIQQFGVSDDRFAEFDLNNGSVIESTIVETIADNPVNSMPAPEIEQSGETGQVRQTDEELERLEKEISVVEQEQNSLSEKKQSAKDHLEKIEAEYKKNYSTFEQELDEIKSRMEADSSIIEHYKDQDVTPIEILFQEINLKLEEAENQIRIFIEAKQRKTMEIENEIKSNRK